MHIIAWFSVLLIILIAVALIYYTTRRLYIVMYGLSGIIQLIAVIYTLTEFEWGRGAILIILVAAALVMMVEGYIIARGRKKSKVSSS